MFKISLLPQRNNNPTTITVLGYKITIDGQEFDFTDMPEGSILPPAAVSAPFHGEITKSEGFINCNIICHYGPNAGPDMLFPELITVSENGLVSLPEFGHPIQIIAEVQDEEEPEQIILVHEEAEQP